ncbi:MAG: ISKra4 family transposase, partial [Gammaproteobacteria bacterium]|nr:ISKra4 family transposase [Gammaproteobacteria bacterium]
QTIDFWHVTEYLGKAAKVMFRGKRNEDDKNEWVDQACHKLKHSVGSATRLLKEMEAFNSNNNLPKDKRATLESAITYFSNNKNKIKYPQNVKKNLPIGSGVTEAACKVIVKQR